MLFSRYRVGSPVPPGWQQGWELPCLVDLPGMPRFGVCRSLDGTRLPTHFVESDADATAVTAADITAAASDVALALAGVESDDALTQHYRRALDDPAILADAVRLWRGVPHPLAQHAPWAVRSAVAADGVLRFALDLWDDTCATGTIRTTETGYAVFAGAQGFHSRHGTAGTLDAAIALVCALVRETRADVLPRLRSALPGWSPATPVCGTRLDALDDAPITIYRVSLRGAQTDPATTITVRADGTVVTSAVVPWDDGEMRREVLAERASFDRARYRQKQDLLAALRRVCGGDCLFNAKGSLNGKLELTLRSGARGRLGGNVRREKDGEIALAFVPNAGGPSLWVRVSQFALPGAVAP